MPRAAKSTAVSTRRRAPKRTVARRKPASYRPRYTPWYAPHMGYVGRALGGIYGGPLGATAGDAIGRSLASGVKSLTGYGPYRAQSKVYHPGQVPVINNGGLPSGSIRISHREYLGDIISSSSSNTFKLQSFLINPGLSETFPWLSQLGINFQQYRMEGCVFEFRTMSADALNSTNTALGSVIMATNYNASVPNFGSRSEMENCEFSQTIKPSESCVHMIECSPKSTPLTEMYVRGGPVPTGQDQRFFDLANFQIASTGCQGTNVNLGSLYVSYTVSLLKPILSDTLGKDVLWAHFNNPAGVTNAVPMGTSNLTPISGATLAATVNASGTVLTIPQTSYDVSYIITWRWSGLGANVLVAPSFTPAGNFVQLNLYANNTYWQTDAPAAGVSTTIYEHSMAILFKGGYSNTPNTITLGGPPTLPGNIIQFDIFITQIPDGSA